MSPFRLLVAFLLLMSGVLFCLTLQTTSRKIGRPFNGYLAFKNGVVGAFYIPSWSGPKQGIGYHDIPLKPPTHYQLFRTRDFLFVVLVPAIVGLLFVLFGSVLCLFLTNMGGKIPILLFHFFAGNYLILSPEFHLTHHFSYLHLFLFVMIPACMVHFALLFPEIAPGDSRIRPMIPYAISLFLFLPYTVLFLSAPRLWIAIEYVVVTYVVCAYLFWIYRLVKTLAKPQLAFSRIMARTLLIGQLVAFVPVLIVTILIFGGGLSFPINFLTPVTLLFPIAVFLGVILGKLRQSQMRLVEVERQATLGSLFSGLAHELNNPLTFLYSNIEPLREMAGRLRNGGGKAKDWNEWDEIVNDMEEGATRAMGIVDNFRFFSSPAQSRKTPVDLHEVLEQSIKILVPKWEGRIEIERHLNPLPPIQGSRGELGQVFVNILANACEAIDGRGKIEIRSHVSGNKIEIRFHDTGGGIPPETLSRIFDPFFTTKPQGEGTGLGLALSLKIVKDHGGTIEVKSAAEKGSEFIVTLPL